jgi:DNA-binding CsgD family transcriptional regulator
MQLTERTRDVTAKSDAMAALARVYREREDWERNRAVLTSLRELVEPQGASATLADVYTELGLCMIPIDGAEALHLIDRAIDVAEAIDARIQLMFAVQMRGVALFIQDRSAESLPLLERAFDLARDTAQPRAMRSVMENLKEAHSELGEAPERERERREEVRTFDRLHGVRAPRVLGQELEWLFTEGDWDLLLRRSIEVDDRVRHLTAVAHHYIAVVAVAREGFTAGRERLWSTYHDLAAVGLPDRAAMGMGLALLIADEHKEALRVAGDVAPAPLPDRWIHPDERGLVGLVGGIAARISGDHAAAGYLLDLALRPRLYLKKRRYKACVAFARAEVARRHGDLRAALASYVEAANESRCRIEGASSWFESLAYQFSAEVRLELGENGAQEAAQRDFIAGLRYWRDAAATFYLRLMRDRAHRLGLTFPADALPQERPFIQPDPLTDRQREIAMLIAGGATNRAIAEQMSLSVRTAESHVEQIRMKLGFKTRAQIAAWVTERYGAVGSN